MNPSKIKTLRRMLVKTLNPCGTAPTRSSIASWADAYSDAFDSLHSCRYNQIR